MVVVVDARVVVVVDAEVLSVVDGGVSVLTEMFENVCNKIH